MEGVGRDRVSRSEHTRVYEIGIKKTRIKSIETSLFIRVVAAWGERSLEVFKFLEIN